MRNIDPAGKASFKVHPIPPSGTPSEIFNVLWGVLVEILGSPATATLLRRSAKKRLGDFPELGELAITRKGFEYVYAVPADWKHANDRLKALPQLAKYVQCLSEDK